MSKKISIVTPTFNEELNIEKLCIEIALEMKKLNYDYEHIVIDNLSTDSTVEILEKITKTDKNLKVIINSRNFGHIRSPIHGLLQANGDAAILMSADFQDPIDLISKYIKEWENGHLVVMGQKTTSDESKFKHYFKKLYYKFINAISEVPLLMDTTGAGLFDRKVIEVLRGVNDPYPYFRGLVSEVTNDVKLLPFHQPKRNKGSTKNNFYTLYDLGIVGIIKHSKIPLRIITFIGLVASFISLLISIIFLFRKLFNWNSFDAGIAPLIIGVFLIGSIQIFLLGFIGEYVMNILYHSRNMPLVIEKKRINFDK
jgi:glycosyltransferase involved in cell wall biosynthesis